MMKPIAAISFSLAGELTMAGQPEHFSQANMLNWLKNTM